MRHAPTQKLQLGGPTVHSLYCDMAAALPLYSGEKQSAEELESIIDCIATFCQMGKTKFDYVRNDTYHDIKAFSFPLAGYVV